MGYTKEEDNIILKRVEEMGYDNPQTWKMLSKELERSHEHSIRHRFDLITSRESKEIKRYTDEDDKFLCEYVQKNGNNQNTFRELAKLFGVPRQSIQNRHNLLTDKNTWNRGPFTKEEDEQILKNVNVFGNNNETFKELAVNLNRPYYTTIKRRYEWLMNKPSKNLVYWTLEEDKHLIEVLFKKKPNDLKDLDGITSLKVDDFIEASTELGRSKNACYDHWNRKVLPIIKTDILGKPQGVEWMKNLLDYIIENKIITAKQIPYNQVVNEIVPGQTSRSVQELVNRLPRERKDGKNVLSKSPLYDICAKRLEEPSPSSYIGNEEMTNFKLNNANEILEVRNSILKGA